MQNIVLTLHLLFFPSFLLSFCTSLSSLSTILSLIFCTFLHLYLDFAFHCDLQIQDLHIHGTELTFVQTEWRPRWQIYSRTGWKMLEMVGLLFPCFLVFFRGWSCWQNSEGWPGWRSHQFFFFFSSEFWHRKSVLFLKVVGNQGIHQQFFCTQCLQLLNTVVFLDIIFHSLLVWSWVLTICHLYGKSEAVTTYISRKFVLPFVL